jgi:exopolysaccharide production protein ExoY
MSFIRVNDAVFLEPGRAATTTSTLNPPTRVVSAEGSAFTKVVIRALDIVISALALIFFSPILVVVGLLVYFQDGGPMFFGQRRIGLDGNEFSCFKFRSMVTNAGQRLEKYLAENAEARIEWAKDHKLKNDPRITKLGRFIRKTSLDEFPQLWNVLKGEMSLVGPRPIVQDEVRKYGLSYSKYKSVKPGITGLWQVAGRNDVTYSRRVAMDRFFSKRKTVPFYLFILVMTVPAVLRQRGSY